jgi:hypothetical protein
MLFGEGAYHGQHVQREPNGDTPLTFLCAFHVSILAHVWTHSKREDFWLKPPEGRLTARAKALRLAASYFCQPGRGVPRA